MTSSSFGGSDGIQFDWRGRNFIQNRVEDDRRRVSGKGLTSSGHFVEDDAERKNIRAQIEFFAAGLLGRHVRDGAHGGAGSRERFACGASAGIVGGGAVGEFARRHRD